jgi:ABC-2 type transport system permease protein
MIRMPHIRTFFAHALVIHELRLLLRLRLVRGALLATAATVALSLWLGWIGIGKRHLDIEQALTLQSAQHAAYLRRYPERLPDAGDVAYYTFHVVPDRPGASAWLSLGDLDTRPAALRIRMLGLHSQLYDGEMNNPEQATAGAFDFSFVLVFLLPLLCACLCHDLATQDREQGRSGLLLSLIASTRGFWLRRLFARYLLACLAVLLPLMIFAACVSGWPAALWLVIPAVALYAAFWVCACAWISLRWRTRSSATNAIAMLGLWAAATMALPALASSLIALWSPTPQGSEIALAHRKQLNDAWDLPKPATFSAFFRAHPEWRDTPPVTGRFHWKWYYAFHHVADLNVEPIVQTSEAAIRARSRLGDRIGLVLPPVAMHSLMDGLADSGSERVTAQRMAIRTFHERLRRYFYPFVFEERPFTVTDFHAIPKPQSAPVRIRHAPLAWVGLSLLSLLALAGVLRQLSGRSSV